MKFEKVMFLHLSVCSQGGGWLPSMHWEGGSASRVSASRGVCIQMGLHPEGSASRGVCIQRGLHPEGSASREVCIQRGLHPEGSASRGVCIQRGVHLGRSSSGAVLDRASRVCLRGGWVDTPPRDTWGTTGYGQRASDTHPTRRHVEIILHCKYH